MDQEQGVHVVPSFTLRELQTGQRGDELRHVLGTTGLLSIELLAPPSESSSYSPRTVALAGLCDCLEDEVLVERGRTNHNIQQSLLEDDSTVRTTLGTATVGTATPLPLMKKDQDAAALQEACGSPVVHAMEDLREDVALASRTFVQSLDRLLHDEENDNEIKQPLLRDAHGKTYSSMTQIVESANHLEHFHSYSKSSSQAQDSGRPALDWHTDAGLFLAFVPAWNCHSPDAHHDDASFWIQEESGTARRAVFSPQASVVIMLGAGAQYWLNLPLQLQATRHAVHLQPGTERTWYGMMHLVPESAIVSPSSSPRRTFGDMKKSLVLPQSGLPPAQDDATTKTISMGCGIETPRPHALVAVSEDNVALETSLSGRRRRRRLQQVEPSACNNSTNFFCWMRCLEIPRADEAEKLKKEGNSLYCVDLGLLDQGVAKAVEPCVSAHNTNCHGSWEETQVGVTASIRGALIDPDANQTSSSPSGEDDAAFCTGGTSMYMDGFHWVHDYTCVIYLFPGWVLNQRWHLVAASLGTIHAGIALEYVIFQRRQILQSTKPGLLRLAMSGLVYGIQLTMGYLLMLVVMTYSGVLFLCTILGIVCGHILFNSQDALLRPLLSCDDDDHKKKQLEKQKKAVEKADDETVDANKCSVVCSSVHHPSITDENSPDHNDTAVVDSVPEGCTPCCQHTL